MQDQFFENFMLLLDEEKKLKSSSYTKSDGSEISTQELSTTVKNYWGLLEPEIQKDYEDQLSNINSSSKVKKFINDVNRSINGVKTSSIEKQLENFSKIELPNHSNKSFIFLEPEFSNILRTSTPNMSKQNAFIGNIQTQLAGIDSTIKDNEKTQLFEVTSNLIAGLITTKSGHSRSTDNSMVNQHGQIKDAELVAEVAKYAIKNIDPLKELDPKTQKFIGGALKQAYKTKLENTISGSLGSVNISDEVQRFEIQKHVNKSRIISSLTGIFSPSRTRANSEVLTNSTPNNKKEKPNRTI